MFSENAFFDNEIWPIRCYRSYSLIGPIKIAPGKRGHRQRHYSQRRAEAGQAAAAPQIRTARQGDRCMNTVTRSLIIGISVVLITSAVLGARAPDSEAENEIMTFYHRYLTTCGDSWY